ncbi:MAG: hypothetical protein AWU54_1145 [Candidatus Frackibacter sp. T328-2]|nr:MAG: hypothetical protein AWU54_1145 [Candidatus Frackibacter sp. T328-2]
MLICFLVLKCLKKGNRLKNNNNIIDRMEIKFTNAVVEGNGARVGILQNAFKIISGALFDNNKEIY